MNRIRLFAVSLRIAVVLVLLGMAVEAAPFISRIEPGFGEPGARVILTGSDFSQAQRVSFGGVPADFTILSAGQISTVVPLGGRTGVIRIESLTGAGATTGDFIVAPRILGVVPERGAPGSLVTLEGENFEDVSNVYYGLTEVPFEVTSASQLAARIPASATNNLQLVALSVAGFGLSPKPFVLTGPGPVIDSFDPPTGAPGSVVFLSGINFAGVTQVRFGTTVASFTSTAENQIQAIVPANAFSSLIVVTGKGLSHTSAVPFVITRAPVIRSFEPRIGRPGTQVIVEGINFTEVTGVSFNGRSVSGIGAGAAGQLQVTVPDGASTGFLRVTNRFGTGVSSNAFVVTTAPVITGIEPAYGPVGSQIRVEGMNFTTVPRTGAVRFGGTAAAYAVTADNQIQVTIPAAISNAFVVVTNPSGTTTSAIPFQVIGRVPFVTEVTPLQGPRGTRIRISGENLTNVTGVYFNGLLTRNAEITSPSQLFVTVPPQVTSGSIVLSNSAGISTNVWIFHAPPQISGFFPVSVNAGQTVTLRGTNLLSARSLKVGFFEVPFTQISPGEIRFVTPTNVVKGAVTVQTPGGIISSTNPLAILPAIYNFSPAFGPVGTVVTVTGSGFSEVKEVRVGGVQAEFAVSTLDRLQLRIPAGVVAGAIRVKTADGEVDSGLPFHVTGNSDLTVSVAVTPNPAVPGEPFTWLVTVTNAGPFSASRIGLTNIFGAGLSIREVTAPVGTFATNANRIEHQFGLLTNGQSLVFQYRSQAAVSGIYTNIVRIGAAEFDPNSFNNLVQVAARVIGDWDRTLEGRLNPGDRRLVVSWPISGLPLRLETTADLVPPILWLPQTNGIQRFDNRFVFTNTSQGRERYFRLVLP